MGQIDKQFIRQLSILVLVNLIALAGWLAFFLKISELSASISATLEAKGNEEIKEEDGRLLAGQVEETQVSREKLESFFLGNDEEEITEFLEGLESLGQHAKLKLEIISVTRTDQNLRLTFRTVGSFASTYYLVKLAEALPMKISFKESRLEAKMDEVSGPVSWNGLFVLDLESFLTLKQNEKN